jgi:hypothetical protein
MGHLLNGIIGHLAATRGHCHHGCEHEGLAPGLHPGFEAPLMSRPWLPPPPALRSYPCRLSRCSLLMSPGAVVPRLYETRLAVLLTSQDVRF